MVLRKAFSTLGIEGKFLRLIKDIYENLTAVMTFSDETSNFSPKDQEQNILLPFLFNIVLEVQDRY
jgi:hypothetical protein